MDREAAASLHFTSVQFITPERDLHLWQTTIVEAIRAIVRPARPANPAGAAKAVGDQEDQVEGEVAAGVAAVADEGPTRIPRSKKAWAPGSLDDLGSSGYLLVFVSPTDQTTFPFFLARDPSPLDARDDPCHPSLTPMEGLRDIALLFLPRLDFRTA